MLIACVPYRSRRSNVSPDRTATRKTGVTEGWSQDLDLGVIKFAAVYNYLAVAWFTWQACER